MVAAERQIKSYTTLEQIGIDDSTLSDTDYFSNIQTIAAAMPNYSRLFIVCNLTTRHQNFAKALDLQLMADGVRGIHEAAETVFEIYRAHTVSVGMPIRIWRNGDDIKIIGQYDVDGGIAKLYPFREVAVTEQVALTYLNGWGTSSSGTNDAPTATKVGRYVNVNFAAEGGLTDEGTIIFQLPEGFRPKATVTMTLLNEKNLTWARFAAYSNGAIRLWGTANLTGRIVGVGGFPI